MRLRRFLWGVVLLVAGLAGTLAMPVQVWRTGRMSVPPLTLSSPDEEVPGRVWIDTDAACGHDARTDVDDCLALWLLANDSRPEIAGISTVFGNAPLAVTHDTTIELVRLLERAESLPPATVHRGSPVLLAEATADSSAADGLVRALEAGPLTVVALGPVTNVARALKNRPELAGNVERVIAVMGRRIGHLFHPSEGSGRGSLLGHGPVFRDFNFVSDSGAVRELLRASVPLVLIPYDAAIDVEITGEDLRRLAMHGEAGAWIEERSHGWLTYWQTDIGRNGFYPFDVMAAAYVLAPRFFRCAEVRTWVGTDPVLFLPLLRAEALLVDRQTGDDDERIARYCPAVEPEFSAWLHRRIRRSADRSTP